MPFSVQHDFHPEKKIWKLLRFAIAQQKDTVNNNRADNWFKQPIQHTDRLYKGHDTGTEHATDKDKHNILQEWTIVILCFLMKKISEQDIGFIPKIRAQLWNRSGKNNPADSDHFSEDNWEDDIQHRGKKHDKPYLPVHPRAFSEGPNWPHGYWKKGVEYNGEDS